MKAVRKPKEVEMRSMAPGVGHCSGGDGPDRSHTVAPLVKWVEEGIPPFRIEASLVRERTVVRARPLCAYQSVAVWDGRGDTNTASRARVLIPALPTNRRQNDENRDDK